MPKGKIYRGNILDMCHHVWLTETDPKIRKRLSEYNYTGNITQKYIFRYRHLSREDEKSQRFETWLTQHGVEVLNEGPCAPRRVRVNNEKFLTYLFLKFKENS